MVVIGTTFGVVWCLGSTKIPLTYFSVARRSWGEIVVLRAENAMLSFANFVEQMSPINVIIMREQLNVKQRQSISETPAVKVSPINLDTKQTGFTGSI